MRTAERVRDARPATTRPAPPALLVAGLLIAVAGCAGPSSRTPVTPAGERPTPRVEIGYASYYARAHHGRRTASGERFDRDALTAAHRTLPYGTRVRVTHLRNGRDVTVRINDRGPFRKGRLIDVSPAAARRLGMIAEGVARVRVEVLE